MKNMLRIFLVAVIAAFTCGLFVITDTTTPEEREAQRKAQERQACEWDETIQARYDFTALTKFLKKTITEKKRWKDIDLTKPKIADKWTYHKGGMVLTSGDWIFRAPNPKEDKFTLTFSFHKDAKSGLEITLNCTRKSKGKFELIDITGDDWEIVEM